LPSVEYLTAQVRSPSVVATVPWKGFGTPSRAHRWDEVRTGLA
jgi:hypothetical protein